MKQIIEVKMKDKGESRNRRKQAEKRQFDLTSAYKLLISAYLRVDQDQDQESIESNIQ